MNSEENTMMKPVSLMGKGYDEFLAKYHKERGYLDAEELSSLRRIKDIEESRKKNARIWNRVSSRLELKK